MAAFHAGIGGGILLGIGIILLMLLFFGVLGINH